MATSQKGERVGGLRGMRGMEVLRGGRVNKIILTHPLANRECCLPLDDSPHQCDGSPGRNEVLETLSLLTRGEK